MGLVFIFSLFPLPFSVLDLISANDLISLLDTSCGDNKTVATFRINELMFENAQHSAWHIIIDL